MMRTQLLVAALLAFTCTTVRGQEVNQPKSNLEIPTLIQQLASVRYEVREKAAQRLITSGQDVADQLVEAARTGSVELRIRALEVLRELALQDHARAIDAEAGIAALTELKGTTLAARATVVQQSLREIRTTRARKRLQRQGASFHRIEDYDEQGILGTETIMVSLDKTWRGALADLDHLKWFQKGIKVRLRGNAFSDEWFARLTELENVIAIELNRTLVQNDALDALQGMSQLRVFQIRYCDRLTDGCLHHLNALSESLQLLKIFDAEITKGGFDDLVKDKTAWRSRYGRGGFLGIGGLANPNGAPGCLVTRVSPNQAASAAGILEYDIITSYNGQKVDHFSSRDENDPDEKKPRTPSLSELIAKNLPGDKVKITLLRGGREIETEVTLGEWD